MYCVVQVPAASPATPLYYHCDAHTLRKWFTGEQSSVQLCRESRRERERGREGDIEHWQAKAKAIKGIKNEGNAASCHLI